MRSDRIVQATGHVPAGNNMLLIAGVFITLTAVLVIARVRVPGDLNAPTLGWMSEQWLAEHRASHPT